MPSKFVIGKRTGFLSLQRSETQIFWSNGRDTILAGANFQDICKLLSCQGDRSNFRSFHQRKQIHSGLATCTWPHWVKRALLWCNILSCGSPLLGRRRMRVKMRMRTLLGLLESRTPLHSCDTQCPVGRGAHGQLPRASGDSMGAQGARGAAPPLRHGKYTPPRFGLGPSKAAVNPLK